MKKRPIMAVRAALTSALAAILVFALAPAAPMAAETLRIHHFLSPKSVTHSGFLAPWAERVARAAGGRLKFEIYPAMQLGGSPRQLFDQARDGVAALTWTLPGYTAGRFPIVEVFELPFVGGSAEATSLALTEFYGRHLRHEFAAIHPVLLHTHAPSSFHMTTKRVARMEDLRGVKLRAPSRAVAAALRALGAIPVGMPVPEVHQAMARGVVDGAALPFEVALPLRIHEVARTHT
ncbi:MAG: TRAP transporter substrate-binding protein DctP, partial [Alphaproteobacteria bacterium]